MRGSLSLDFILSLVLVTASVASFFALAGLQLENTVIASTQFKAEAMAMSIGSAINHFAAIQPETNSYLEMDFAGMPQSQGVNSFGMPGFSVYVDDSNCEVVIDETKDLVIVTVTAYRMDSSQPETITAQYPLVDVEGAPQVSCDKGLKLIGRHPAIPLVEALP